LLQPFRWMRYRLSTCKTPIQEREKLLLLDLFRRFAVEVLVVGLRIVAGMVDDAVPMIRRRIERIELQWNTAGIDYGARHELAAVTTSLSYLPKRAFASFKQLVFASPAKASHFSFATV